MGLFEVFSVNCGGDGFYVLLSSLSLKFDISSYCEWILVTFVLNGRLRVLCIRILCDIFCGLWGNRLWFPFWAISNCLVFSFRVSSGSACRIISVCRFFPDFVVPILFDMPIGS